MVYSVVPLVEYDVYCNIVEIFIKYIYPGGEGEKEDFIDVYLHPKLYN